MGDNSSHHSDDFEEVDLSGSSGGVLGGLKGMFSRYSRRQRPSNRDSEVERGVKEQKSTANARRIMATAQAIADDDNHPNNERFAVYVVCLRCSRKKRL